MDSAKNYQIEIINKLLNILKKYWIVILIFSLIGGVIGFLYAYNSKPIYKAQCTFMVNEDESSKLTGGIGALLGNFGIGASSGKLNLEKLLELSKSRNIIQRVLFCKVKVNGNLDFMINHFINLYSLNEDDSAPVNFTNSDFDKFDKAHNKMLLKVYNMLTGDNGIVENQYSRETGIMALGISTNNEDLSISYVDTLFDRLGKFYIDKSIERELKTYTILSDRVTKLYNEMNSKEQVSAQLQDNSLGIWKEIDRVPSKVYSRDANITAVVYGEALKNLEISSFALKNKMPIIQAIDKPIAPIKPLVKSKSIFGGGGFLLCGFLCTLFLFIRKELF